MGSSFQFRLAVQSPDPPSKVFDRTSNLNGTQIISYRVSPDLKWSTLVGIAPGSAEKYAAADPSSLDPSVITCSNPIPLLPLACYCSLSCCLPAVLVHIMAMLRKFMSCRQCCTTRSSEFGARKSLLNRCACGCRPHLIKGFMQLYSVEQKRSQALEAHSAAFTTLDLGGKQTQAIVFTTKTYANAVMNSKIHCIALGGGAHKKNAELFFPSEFTDDFPVSLHIRCVSASCDCVWVHS